MGNTVYIVTSGDYSDYSIRAVFDNEDLAKRFTCQYGGEIELWEMNENTTQIMEGLTFWRVWVEKNGDVTDSEKTYPWGEQQTTAVPIYRMCSLEPYLEVHCWARDEDHAIKIATEKRQEWMAALSEVEKFVL